MKADIIVMSHDPQSGVAVQNSLQPLYSRVFHGAGYPSFSKLVNDCILSSDKEIVILCSYKVRPGPADVDFLLGLLEKGYGLACLYRFAFFGLHKNLIRKVGFMDERFVGGGYEDCDMLRRLMMHDIAYYEAECVPYIKKKSTWNYAKSERFFRAKWTHDEENGIVFQNIPDEAHPEYQLDPPVEETAFLDRSHSVFLPASGSFCENRFVQRNET